MADISFCRLKAQTVSWLVAEPAATLGQRPRASLSSPLRAIALGWLKRTATTLWNRKLLNEMSSQNLAAK